MMTLSDKQEYLTAALKCIPIHIKTAAVYGSWARGTQKEESDLDLLLISDDINPKRHRRGAHIAMIKERVLSGIPLDIMLLTTSECISNFRNHNPLFLDIATEGVTLFDEDGLLRRLITETKAYISDKDIRKSGDGWTFHMPYRAAGFLSEVSNEDFARAMLTDGERDYQIGVNILEDGYSDKAVYHFQQAVEKAVKAILICFGIYKKTHFVGEILSEEVDRREIDQEWQQRLKQVASISLEIEPEVTWSRYPGIAEDALWIPSEEYTADDANQIREKCNVVMAAAREFVSWWFGEA
ncbi:MAG TPA: hypothetical protein DDX84_05670 [Nitrospiraceae bacterium]|nr:hypothetical protein [Nitrospiraceae bacterium]